MGGEWFISDPHDPHLSRPCPSTTSMSNPTDEQQALKSNNNEMVVSRDNALPVPIESQHQLGHESRPEGDQINPNLKCPPIERKHSGIVSPRKDKLSFTKGEACNAGLVGSNSVARNAIPEPSSDCHSLTVFNLMPSTANDIASQGCAEPSRNRGTKPCALDAGAEGVPVVANEVHAAAAYFAPSGNIKSKPLQDRAGSQNDCLANNDYFTEQRLTSKAPGKDSGSTSEELSTPAPNSHPSRIIPSVDDSNVTPCTKCQQMIAKASLIQCADCKRCTHGYCLNPPVAHQPSVPWRCFSCLRKKATICRSVSFDTQTADRTSAYLEDSERRWLPPRLRNKPWLAALLPPKPNYRSLPSPVGVPPSRKYGKPVLAPSGVVVPIRYVVDSEYATWSDPDEEEPGEEAYNGASDVEVPPGKRACEHCKMPHSGAFGSGRFCSSKCARTVGGLSRRRHFAEKKENSENDASPLFLDSRAAVGIEVANMTVPVRGSRGGRGRGRGGRGRGGRGRGGRGRGRGRGVVSPDVSDRSISGQAMATAEVVNTSNDDFDGPDSEESGDLAIDDPEQAKGVNVREERGSLLGGAYGTSAEVESNDEGSRVSPDDVPDESPKNEVGHQSHHGHAENGRMRPQRRRKAPVSVLDSLNAGAVMTRRGRGNSIASRQRSRLILTNNTPVVKPGKGYKFCHECGELVANRRFVCEHCGASNPSSKIAKRTRGPDGIEPQEQTTPSKRIKTATELSENMRATSDALLQIQSKVSRPDLASSDQSAMKADSTQMFQFDKVEPNFPPRALEEHMISHKTKPSDNLASTTSPTGKPDEPSKAVSARQQRDALFRSSHAAAEETPSESSEDYQPVLQDAWRNNDYHYPRN